MLQTIDRALTLLVDMNEDEHVFSLQARRASDGSTPIDEIVAECKTVIKDANTQHRKNTPIGEILQKVTNDCDAITKKYKAWIYSNKRLYFIEAILHITIIMLDHNDSSIIKTMELDGNKGVLEELSPKQVTEINPEKDLSPNHDGHLVKVVSAACGESSSCTIS